MKMKVSARHSASSHRTLSIAILAAFLALLPVTAQSQTIAQSSRLAANAAGGGLEIVADLTGAEAVSIDIAGPGIGVVHMESKESPVWLPTADLSDGSYRFEVQLVDAGTGKIVNRLAGLFSVRKGEVLVPGKRGDSKIDGLVPGLAETLGRFVKSALDFLVPDAEAADLTASGSVPSVFFDDTEIGGTEWQIQGAQTYLDLNCDIEASSNLTIRDLQGGSRNVFAACSSSNNLNSLGVDTSGDLHFADNGMFFDRALKRLGINNTVPSYIIDAVGTSRIMLRQSTAGAAKSVAMRVDGPAIDLHAQNSDLWIRADLPAPAHNIYMLSDRVGVGLTDPDSKLHVIGTTPPQFIVQNDAGNARMDFRRSAATGVSQILFGTGPVAGGTMDYQMGMFLNSIFQIRLVSDGTKNIALTPEGNVGIGKTAPIAKLDVAGVVNASGGFTNISDARLKDNVAPIQNALGKVMALEGVSFTWKKDRAVSGEFPGGAHYGVVAQQAEGVMPEVVRTGPGGEKAVSYSEMVPVLIEAMKEQQALISERDARIEKLEKALEMMEKRLTSLETPAKTVAAK